LSYGNALLIAAGLLVPLVVVAPEIFYLTPDLNDGAFHLGVARNVVAAIREGTCALDFWVPTWLAGFPLFHYYQPGPYLALALIDLVSPHHVPLLFWYRTMTLLVLTLVPLTTYIALRWLGLGRDVAACAALLSCTVSTPGYYGIELGSFTWSGYGLFNQAVAFPLLPLALAGGWRALQRGGATLSAAAIVAATFLAHVLFGYITVLSLGLVPFLAGMGAPFGRRLLALLRFYVQVLALIAFFVVPLWLHLAVHAKSLYDAASKFDSHGMVVILTRLFSGSMLDDGRFPILTLLALIGAYLCARRWLENESAVHGWLLWGFVFWTLLSFGRATWGPLVDLLPMSRGLHMERLVCGLQLFGVWLAAVALGDILRRCRSVEPRILRGVAVVGACGLLVGPVLAERARYAAHNARLVREAKDAFDEEITAFAPVLDLLRDSERRAPGRVYAGRSGGWGADYQVGQVPVYQLLSAEAIPTVGHAPFSWALSTDVQLALDWPDESTVDLYDVRYLLTDQRREPPTGSELLMQSGKHRLYRLRTEGRFGLVTTPVAVSGPLDDLWYVTKLWAASPWPRKRAHPRVLAGRDVAGGLPVARMTDPFRLSGPGARGERNVFESPGLYTAVRPARPKGVLVHQEVSRQAAQVVVLLDSPGVVLFKSTYHPWWRASVDGIRVKTMLLMPGFIGVEVPAGRHRLRLEYGMGWVKPVLLLLGILAASALELRKMRFCAG